MNEHELRNAAGPEPPENGNASGGSPPRDNVGTPIGRWEGYSPDILAALLDSDSPHFADG
jgi:hypothetical protein